jgi:hypothetical protein
MGNGAWGLEEGKGKRDSWEMPNAQCPMTADARSVSPTPRPHSQTYAQCPMPHAAIIRVDR